MELKGCTAMVTGGSGGLGQRICRAPAQNDVNVVVNFAEWEARAKGVADELKHLGVRAIAVCADVTEQLITFCCSESVTGQTILMDSGRV